MEFSFFFIILLVLSAVLIVVGLKILLQPGWFAQFIKGFIGFTCLFIAFLTIMSGLDVASYSRLLEGDKIANISFTKDAPQEFKTTVVQMSTGDAVETTIYGDLWQIDTKILRIALSGSTPFYKLDRLSGRYYSLDQERSAPRTVQNVTGESLGFDLWQWFKGSDLGLISAEFGSATFMPMADGATYSISVTSNGLVAKPVNNAARNAVANWQ